MPKNDSTSGREKRARRRHPTGIYDNARALDTLRATPDNSETVELLADVLAVWARYMIAERASVAADIYRTLVNAWQDNRAETGYDDARERLAHLYHIAASNRLDELLAEERSPASSFDRERAAALLTHDDRR